ncbi:MAG: hypothetical protein M1142_05295 [Patescibacteria group bacterium]|nr:hypothetical protein [Patescibacteria group bacterium]
MRSLEIGEVNKIQFIIDAATEEAKRSPCAKSKRGAIVFKDGQILGRDHNHPNIPHTCVPDVCMSYCSVYTTHAERGACQDAIFKGNNLDGASILHMKVKKGLVMPVEQAQCLDCSSYLMKLRSSGIYIIELILMHVGEDNRIIFKGHTIDEFFQNSISSLEL